MGTERRRTAPATVAGFCCLLNAPLARAEDGLAEAAAGTLQFLDGLDPTVMSLAGASIVLILMGAVTRAVLTTRRLEGSSLFNRLFVVVAVTAAFFSAISSAIGFGLITGQESRDFFRNAILPPAFGVFVFFLAVAIWVGGAELVRNRDWFRRIGRGPLADMLFFAERTLKIFVIVPILATVLFFVSTWTTVVGVAGVDAVRHTYNFELARLQAECAGIVSYRQREFLFLDDLRQSVRDVRRVAESERLGGSQSGAAGDGAVTAYFTGVADWLTDLEDSVAQIIEDETQSGMSPYALGVCSDIVEGLKSRLASNAFDNYRAWSRDIETQFNDFAAVLNRWRHDLRIETFLEQQVSSFDRANPIPAMQPGRVTPTQSAAMEAYAGEVRSALASLVRRVKLAKPPVPLQSAAEASPERGLEIFTAWFEPPQEAVEEETRRVSRTAAVVASEFVPGLSTITPRDAVLKNASIFSDVWALAIAWDYAAYVLMLAFLFFPSAERAARFKD